MPFFDRRPALALADLLAPHGVVQAALRHQFVVAAALHDAAAWMTLACITVDSRCAIRMLICVACSEISRTVSVTCCSVNESSADVASSKISRRGSRSSARAIDRRWRSPPESL